MDKPLGSMLCPYCGKLISKNAETCMHCGRKVSGSISSLPFMQNLLRGNISFVDSIVAVCIVLYVIALLLDPRAILRSPGLFSFLSPGGEALLDLGMTGSGVVAAGRWWTVITAIYLHGGLLHIFFNLMWVRQLGPVVEELYGPSRFFVIFTIAGAAGFLASNTLGVPYTIGASGSIFGLLGALVFYGRHRGGTFGAALYRQTAQWAIILFILGFLMSGVNNFAHGGGFIGGYLSAMLVGYQEKSRESHVHRNLALGCIAITVIAFIMVIVQWL